MGRSASIDPLALHNFRSGTDSIIIKFDNSKTDGTGERVKPKNCYANPYSPEISSVLALGMWFLLYPDQYSNGDKLFIKTGSAKKSATKRYSEQLTKMMNKYKNQIAQWSVPARIKAHSARKGAATYLTSSTLNPPPMSSVAMRGEWSQGKIQDIYFNFAMPGDHYCGRMLAGLDSNDSTFQVLPPHFTESMENPDIQEGLNICFGTIFRKHIHGDEGSKEYLKPVLLLALASIVYHEEWIRGFFTNNNQHPFRNIPLFSNNRPLLNRLKALVTINATPNMPFATGIPTHIRVLEELREIKQECRRFHEFIAAREENIKKWVKEAIQENDRTNGIISMPVFLDTIDGLRKELTAAIASSNSNTSGGAPAVAATTNDNILQVDFDVDDDDDAVENVDNLPLAQGFQEQTHGDEGTKFRSYYYNNKWWHVPSDWKFPRQISLRNAFVFWMKGQACTVTSGSVNEFAPIRPFRKFEHKAIPNGSEQSLWRSGWKPICDMILSFVNPAEIPFRPRDITTQQLDEWYERGMAGIRTKVTYIFNNKYDIGNWKVTTWSKYISNKEIMKNGTEEDKVRARSVQSSRMKAKKKRPAGQDEEQANRHVRQRPAERELLDDAFGNIFVATEKAHARATEDVDDEDNDVMEMIQAQDHHQRTDSSNPSLLLRVPTVLERSLPDARTMSSATYRASVVAMLKDDKNYDTDDDSS